MKLVSLITGMSFLCSCHAMEPSKSATDAMHEWIMTKSAINPEAIYTFLHEGADPNAPNPLDNNHVPLMTAASPVFYPELAVALIENGAVVDEQVIEWVISSAKVDIMLYYLRQAPPEIIAANQDEYLCRAIKRYGQYSIVNWREENSWDSQAIKPLLEEFQFEQKENHLILAIQERCPHEMITKFIQLGIVVSHPVMRSCLINNTSVMQILIDAGGDPNFQDLGTGLTPFFEACRFRMPETALCLLERGADPCKLAYHGQLIALEHVPGLTKDPTLAYKIVLGMIRNGLTFHDIPDPTRPRIPVGLTQLVKVLPSAYAFVSGGIFDYGSVPAELPMDVLRLIMHSLLDTLPRFVL